jgi:CspA family cold shock protein
MENGSIKKIMKDRGFGFIRTEDGKEVFFHRSECRSGDFETFEQGQSVDFEMENDPKGPRARSVRAASGKT